MNSTSYSRYLEAKRTVDERALNLRVWSSFINRLQSTCSSGEQVRVLDLGAGTGNSLFRVLDELEPCNLKYTVVDIEIEHLKTLEKKLLKWVENSNGTVNKKENEVEAITPDGFVLNLRVVTNDIGNYLLESRTNHKYEAVIAQAILDLLDLPKLLPLLKSLTAKEGLWYFPINFDGMTMFMPTFNSQLDPLVEVVYHDSMKKEGVDRSHTGRNLLVLLRELGMSIVEAGSSDWIVIPDSNGKYAGDEAYFLKHILFFVRSELLKSARVDNEVANHWHKIREKQVDEGVLIYIAHQLDVLAANH